MGKALIITFKDEEETTFNELVHFLRRKNSINLMDAFSMESILEYDGLVIDLRYRIVKVKGKSIELTNYEYEILYLLAKSHGQVFSKEQIYTQVWDSSYHGAEDNVMSLIRRLRKKIEPNPANPIYILTVWGIGYKFNCEMKKRHLL